MEQAEWGTQESRPGHAVPRARAALGYAGEGRLGAVGGALVHRVLDQKVVQNEHGFAVLDVTVAGLRLSGLVALQEGIGGDDRQRSGGRRHPDDFVQHRSGLSCTLMESLLARRRGGAPSGAAGGFRDQAGRAPPVSRAPRSPGSTGRSAHNGMKNCRYHPRREVHRSRQATCPGRDRATEISLRLSCSPSR